MSRTPLVAMSDQHGLIREEEGGRGVINKLEIKRFDRFQCVMIRVIQSE